MQISNYIKERVEEICKDNSYLLDEPEVKLIIMAWQSNFETFEFIIKCLNEQLKLAKK